MVHRNHVRRQAPRGSRAASLVVLLCLALLAPTGVAEAAPLPRIWMQAASFPSDYTARWDFAYADLPTRGEVVLFGGAPARLGDTWYADTWIYSNSTGAWA